MGMLKHSILSRGQYSFILQHKVFIYLLKMVDSEQHLMLIFKHSIIYEARNIPAKYKFFTQTSSMHLFFC